MCLGLGWVSVFIVIYPTDRIDIGRRRCWGPMTRGGCWGCWGCGDVQRGSWGWVRDFGGGLGWEGVGDGDGDCGVNMAKTLLDVFEKGINQTDRQ